MDIESYRAYCLSMPHSTEDTPFGENILAFRVGKKMFALCDIDDFNSINLKCNPEKAVELREQYSGIRPGYHMNKKHWNTVDTDGSVSDDLIRELIDHSYDLVIQSLPQRERIKLTTGPLKTSSGSPRDHTTSK